MQKEQEFTDKISELISKYSSVNSAVTKALTIHEIHKILLKVPISRLQSILSSIYTPSFSALLLEQSQLHEPYSYFCYRILDHLCFVPSIREKIVSQGAVKTCLEAIKSTNYEKTISALSLLTSTLGVQEVYLDFIENQGIKLLYNLLQTTEIEYIFYILRIFDWLLNSQKIYRDCLLHMGIADALKYNLKNNADLQKSLQLFGQAKKIKDEIEILEDYYFNKAFN